MIDFDERFFEPEVRDGFYVKGMMKRFWASSMECLMEVDRICRKYKIKYFVYYGTLLGTIRHKGWIPWDDDLDIAMLRSDFSKFVKACETELRAPFSLFNVEQSCMFPTRILNTYYTSMEDYFLEQFHGCPYPSGLDIFVLDKIPMDPVEQKAVKLLHQVVRYVAQRSDARWEDGYCQRPDEKGTRDHPSMEQLEKVVREIEIFTGATITMDETLPMQMTRLANRIAAMYDDSDSSRVARIHNWSIKKNSQGIPIEYFKDTVYLPFENIEVPVPIAYHEVLTMIKGPNYMTPIKFKSAHEYPCYKSKEDELMAVFKSCNVEPPEYLFE